MAKNRRLKTHSGHILSFKESKFIEYIVAGKSELEAYHMAGYTGTNPANNIKVILGKGYMIDELEYRLQQIKEASIADRLEILSVVVYILVHLSYSPYQE